MSPSTYPLAYCLISYPPRPRDGKAITPQQFNTSIQQVYHVSAPLTAALIKGGVDCCSKNGTITLSDLAIHNPNDPASLNIEHDASIVHVDVKPGQTHASTVPDKALVEAVAKKYNKGLTLASFAEIRVNTEKKLQAPLVPALKGVTLGEATMAHYVLKGSGSEVVDVKNFVQWFGQERLPKGYTPPAEELSLQSFAARRTELTAHIANLTAQTTAPVSAAGKAAATPKPAKVKKLTKVPKKTA